jgi:hypothetical protein
VSRLATIFTCLLALLVASPLCCCAGEVAKQEEGSCCCCGEGKKEKKSPDHQCLCATDDPREAPDPVLPHPGQGGVSLALQPACVWLPVTVETDASLRPRWQPSVPWHAPPGERRALLVSRTL